MDCETYTGLRKGFNYARYDGKFWEQQLVDLGICIPKRHWYSGILDILSPFVKIGVALKELIVPRHHEYIKPTLREIALEDALTPLQTQTQQDGSFVINGVNSSETISRLAELTGLPISELERRMLPDDRSMYKPKRYEYYGSGSGFGGFLKPGESLLEVMTQDNDYVQGQRLTHQDVAKPLFQMLNAFFKAMKEGASPYDTFYFRLHGKTYGYIVFGFPMGQCCPFNDGIIIPGQNFLVKEFDGEPQRLDLRDETSLKCKTFTFAWLHPYMIARYGFYEGNVDFRKDPKKIVDFFGLHAS
jgi:hypothetical protein